MTGESRRDPEAIPRRALGTRIRRVKGDLLLGVEEKALSLNGPAVLIFELLDGQRSTAEVARRLADAYGIAEHEALVDVQDFLDDLSGRGIVEWRHGN